MHKQAVTRGERMILAAVLALAGGCQLPQMQVSPPLDAVPAVPVEGPFVRKWSDPVRFGAWYTTSVYEGETDRRHVLAGARRGNPRRLPDATRSIRPCSARTTARPRVRWSCSQCKLAGHVDFDAHWNIRSVDRMVGSRSLGTIVGYEIRKDEAVIGAVQTVNRPQVWIAPSLTPLEQDRVAAVVATLLLYRPLQDALETEQSR